VLTVCRSIKRVIFESIWKNNGSNLVPLQISEIKQIAGRAGRYKTAHQAVTEDQAKESAVDPVIGLDDTPVIVPENTTVGYATTLDQVELRGLKEGMEREAEPIKTAGLFPPSLIVERFANYFPPGTPFSYIMLRLHEISNIHPRFRLCALKDQLAIADAIHLIKNLSIQDRITLCAAPSNMRDKAEKAFLQGLATCIAENESGDLLELPNLPLEILDTEPSGERNYLKDLERLHKMLVLYLWLSYRFPNIFTSRTLTTHVTKLVEEKIEQTLTQFSFTERHGAGFDIKRRKAIEKYVKGVEAKGSNTIVDG
jgi:ATP-dependent RNA helicase SUPV3L1/SUV3